ncbi:nitroreductase/quinone reductase family protein [Phytomonospora endophytica]|uniref:Deazaflavin-dependent oxidoreductase (Nitroreductase family) n=1 Tax=Phytomonospora endophytica TaxID=714109 RepID=A0A841FSV7_9ACTN|nr:nitroreductase/quinone reductase family protein [Phytomonospora endophytica]MBB6035609.1 deazaflavin-dependent oxidoreductase (nitroreductase family) [Phytomonospora endophytica]GIG70028.1 hemerythrin [Phytomonospora endophytica]
MSEHVHDFQRWVIDEFRANRGKVGGMFEGSTLALLTTIGAKSGLRRTSPLGYLHIDGKAVVVASAMGADRHPGWYHNVLHNPVVSVETGTETYQAIAAVPTVVDRENLWAEAIAQAPGYADYQQKTSRIIPVVVLHRIDESPGAERVRGLGDFIVEGHDWLRDELAKLRRQVDAIADGGDPDVLTATPPDLGRQMRTHCLDFCAALKQHHTGEDRGGFPALAQRFPDLAAPLRRLGEEHEVVARLQEEIRALVDAYVPGETDPARLRDELGVLADRLEAHFDYEEWTIVDALNTMGPAPVIP